MQRLIANAGTHLLRPLAHWLSPAGHRARLSVLIYHRVLEQPDPLRPGTPDSAAFRWQMELLDRHFNVLPLSVAVQRLQQGCLPARAVCVTFDDGYADNAELALPILRTLGIPATFFIATGYLDGGRMWNDTLIEAVRRLPDGQIDLSRQQLGVYTLTSAQDRYQAVQRLIGLLKYRPANERQAQADSLAALAASPLPQNLMLRSHQLKSLHQAGMEIGAHTVTHPILALLPPTAAQDEISAGKAQLEALLGERIRLFAYPNGKPGQDYQPEHVAMIKASGFEAAVATTWGVSSAQTDRWQLPRFTPWDATPARFMARLLWNCRFASSTSGY